MGAPCKFHLKERSRGWNILKNLIPHGCHRCSSPLVTVYSGQTLCLMTLYVAFLLILTITLEVGTINTSALQLRRHNLSFPGLCLITTKHWSRDGEQTQDLVTLKSIYSITVRHQSDIKRGESVFPPTNYYLAYWEAHWLISTVRQVIGQSCLQSDLRMSGITWEVVRHTQPQAHPRPTGPASLGGGSAICV